MILLDYSNILHRAVHVDVEFNLQNLRSIMLNQILGILKKHSEKYGKLIICLDGQKNWRYKEFKHYKATRKSGRKESPIDWKFVFECSRTVEEELKTYFPYQVLKVDIAEADDIIAHLALETNEKTLIMSSDSDMTQLLVNPNVDLFSFYHQKFVHEPDPLKKLIIGIVKGQGGKDGIPNILSPEDSFVTKTRQKPVRQELLDRALTSDPTVFCENKEMMDRYKLNQKLIDMRYIPEYVHEAIAEEIAKPTFKRPRLYKYFMSKGLKLFMGDIKTFMQ